MFARFFVFLLLLNLLFAQQLPKMSVIGKAEKSSDELVAKRDANGRYCAGIKVVSNMDGFSYDSYNGVVDMDDKPGEDLVYLQPDERVLIIYHEGYEPLKLILSEYGIHLHPKEVWTIKIGGETLNQNGLSVVFLIQPTVEQIEVDGKPYDIGNKKPLMLEPGQHKVKITKRGYRTIEKEITVDKEHVVFSFNLQEVDLVPVTINSQPTGAQIFIDGMERGRTSKAMNLFPGTYQLKLTLQGYLPLQQSIEVKENQSNNFNFNLTKNAGYLKVNIEPNDALLTINGKTYSYSTAIELLPGQYQITVSKSGYLDITDQIEIKLGETVTRNYQLTKNSGILVVNVNPDNAQVLINKENYTGKNRIELPPGLYRVEISADGYYGITENVTIERGQTLEKSYRLRQKTGKLNFSISPAEAQVTLKRNGRVIKTWQGANYLKDLPVGAYSLEIKAEGYVPQTKTITISDQKLANVDVTLKKGLASGQSFTDEFGIEWVWVEGGSFKMGCTSEQSECSDDEKPVHEVFVDGFYMSKYEVTQAQWKAVMGTIVRQQRDKANPSWPLRGEGDNFPIYYVSWEEAQEFCRRLSRKTGATIRLPTEAEWEYAARGGQKSRGYEYAGSNNIDAVAWYAGNSGGRTHPVGQKQPNELGLYDMSGNVWEWCQDWYSKEYYSRSPRNNPQGPEGGSGRVLRGGSWVSGAWSVRVANRGYDTPSLRYGHIGFRLLRTR